MGASSSSSVVDTKLYDLLDVAPDASVAGLRKAYKRQALRLHPDKGGDPEGYKAMKDAYDILIDPEKRKMYDKYGAAMVGVMNGEPPSKEAIVAICKNISKRERLIATFVMISGASFVVSPLVEVSLRWDGTNRMPWTFVFIPFWLIEAGMLFLLLKRAGVPEPEEGEADMDDETSAMHSEAKRKLRRTKIFGSSAILLLVALKALIATKLEGALNCSWVMVLSPWTFLEFLLLAVSAANTQEVWAALEDRPKFSDFLVQRLAWGLARLVTSLLVMARAAEVFVGSWCICLIPLFVCAAMKVAYTARLHRMKEQTLIQAGMRVRLDGLQKRPELNGREGLVIGEKEASGRWIVEMIDGEQLKCLEANLQPVDGKPPLSPTKVVCCSLAVWLPWLLIAALKLDGLHVSAFLMFIPVFLPVCCIACCFSCGFWCVTAEVLEDMLKAEPETDNSTSHDPHVNGESDDVESQYVRMD